jgi:hypothetical protein
MKKHSKTNRDLYENQLNLDPIRFLEFEKKEILYKLTSEFDYSQEEALMLFNSMMEILLQLKPMRDCQSGTDDYLKETVSNLRRGSKLLIVMHLLNTMENSRSWSHAHNSLVYYANRFGRLKLPRMVVSDAEILILLEAETETRIALSPTTDASNPLVFEEKLLNAFYLAFDNYLWEHTSHHDFINWFRADPVGKPLFKNRMITYFCHAVGKIEHKMIEAHKPENINHWIKPLINGNNYSLLKSRASESNKTSEIDQKLFLI